MGRMNQLLARVISASLMVTFIGACSHGGPPGPPTPASATRSRQHRLTRSRRRRSGSGMGEPKTHYRRRPPTR